jgi:hypothetical protein
MSTHSGLLDEKTGLGASVGRGCPQPPSLLSELQGQPLKARAIDKGARSRQPWSALSLAQQADHGYPQEHEQGPAQTEGHVFLLVLLVPGGSAAGNRGADSVKRLARGSAPRLCLPWCKCIDVYNECHYNMTHDNNLQVCWHRGYF